MSDFDGESTAVGPAAFLASTRITSAGLRAFEPAPVDLRREAHARFGRFVVGPDECIDMRFPPLNGGKLRTGQEFAPND